MTEREALKLALEAMTYADACLKRQLTTKTKHEYAQDLLLEAATAIKEALAQQDVRDEIDRGAKTLRETYLAQPEQEPVAMTITGKLGNIYSFTGDYSLKKGDKIYTAPPQRTWVGLTGKEVAAIFTSVHTWHERAEAIEAKLKEKNT